MSVKCGFRLEFHVVNFKHDIRDLHVKIHQSCFPGEVYGPLVQILTHHQHSSPLEAERGGGVAECKARF